MSSRYTRDGLYARWRVIRFFFLLRLSRVNTDYRLITIKLWTYKYHSQSNSVKYTSVTTAIYNRQSLMMNRAPLGEYKRGKLWTQDIPSVYKMSSVIWDDETYAIVCMYNTYACMHARTRLRYDRTLLVDYRCPQRIPYRLESWLKYVDIYNTYAQITHIHTLHAYKFSN